MDIHWLERLYGLYKTYSAFLGRTIIDRTTTLYYAYIYIYIYIYNIILQYIHGREKVNTLGGEPHPGRIWEGSLPPRHQGRDPCLGTVPTDPTPGWHMFLKFKLEKNAWRRFRRWVSWKGPSSAESIGSLHYDTGSCWIRFVVNKIWFLKSINIKRNMI